MNLQLLSTSLSLSLKRPFVILSTSVGRLVLKTVVVLLMLVSVHRRWFTTSMYGAHLSALPLDMVSPLYA